MPEKVSKILRRLESAAKMLAYRGRMREHKVTYIKRLITGQAKYLDMRQLDNLFIFNAADDYPLTRL